MQNSDLEKLIKNSKDIKVPSDLLSKIKNSVNLRARVLEKRRIIWSSVKVGVSLATMIYFLTGTLINLINSDFFHYVSGFSANPYLILTYDGVNALLEQVPLITLTIFIVALIYLISHRIIKGLKNYPSLYGRVMASFAVIFLTFGMTSGLALASSNNPKLNDFSAAKIFKPFLREKIKGNFSSVGTVTDVKKTEDGSTEITILQPDGEEKTVELKETDEKLDKGQKLFIIHEKMSRSEKRKLRGDFVKIL